MSTKLTIFIPVWLDKILAFPLLIFRHLRFGSAFRKIPLGEYLFAIVSPLDYYRLSNFNWFAKNNGKIIYAYRCDLKSGRKMKFILMHREIMNSPEGFLIDHKNRNSLDNRDSNLRLATRLQNNWNMQKDKSKTTSKYNGVSFDKFRNLWASQINNNCKRIHLGRFKNEIDAAKAFDEAARKYHGEFANLNFPDKRIDPLGDWSFRICYGKFTG